MKSVLDWQTNNTNITGVSHSLPNLLIQDITADRSVILGHPVANRSFPDSCCPSMTIGCGKAGSEQVEAFEKGCLKTIQEKVLFDHVLQFASLVVVCVAVIMSFCLCCLSCF